MVSTPGRRDTELKEHEAWLRTTVLEQVESVKMRCTIRLYVTRTGTSLKVIATEIGLPEWRLREFLRMASLELLEFEAVDAWCAGKPTCYPEILVVALAIVVARAPGPQAHIMWADLVDALILVCEKIGRPLTDDERRALEFLSLDDY